MVVKVAGANQGKDSDGRALAHHTVVSEFGMESVWQRVGAAASPADYGAAAAAVPPPLGSGPDCFQSRGVKGWEIRGHAQRDTKGSLFLFCLFARCCLLAGQTEDPLQSPDTGSETYQFVPPHGGPLPSQFPFWGGGEARPPKVLGT